jgi:hypothetical protein
MICFSNRAARRGVQQAVQMHRRLAVPSLFLIAALIGSAGNAQAVECQSEKGAGYPWAWREIDGKRCWYKGQPGMDKKLLRWAESGTTAPAAASASASAKRRPPVTTEDAERERLLRSYWPPLPPADVFGDRFNAVRGDRL